jgi:hypothetical protein
MTVDGLADRPLQLVPTAHPLPHFSDSVGDGLWQRGSAYRVP